MIVPGAVRDSSKRAIGRSVKTLGSATNAAVGSLADRGIAGSAEMTRSTEKLSPLGKHRPLMEDAA